MVRCDIDVVVIVCKLTGVATSDNVSDVVAEFGAKGAVGAVLLESCGRGPCIVHGPP